MNTFVLDRGLPKSGATGGSAGNPLTSGRTFIELLPFYRRQQLDGDDADPDIKTNGVEFSVFYDNRDFFANPTRGSALRFDISRDFGGFDSSNSWTVIQAEFDITKGSSLPLTLF